MYSKSSSAQFGYKYLNGRIVYLGERIVINFGWLLGGRFYLIELVAAGVLGLRHAYWPYGMIRSEDKGGPSISATGFGLATGQLCRLVYPSAKEPLLPLVLLSQKTWLHSVL